MTRLSQIAIVVLMPLILLMGCASAPVYNLPPLVPVNTSPTNSTDVLIDAQTTFIWQPSETAEYYEFHIFNNETNDIEQYARRNLRADRVCQNGQCSLTIGVVLPIKKDHAWRVRAGNYAGLSSWSRTRFNMIDSNSFSSALSSASPNVPSPVSPDGTEVQAETLVEFVWRNIPDVTGYDFHIFDAVKAEMVDPLNDLPATTVCQGTELCRITRSVKLSPSEAHAWRIRAVNNNGRSEWTRTEFKVIR